MWIFVEGSYDDWEWIWFVKEFPGIHIEAIQPPVPAPVTHIDYSEEAVEYEKKLVQVIAALFSPVDWHLLV